MENKATETVEVAKMAEAAKASAQTLELRRSSPQALARLRPHAASRASGMKISTGWQTAVLPKI